MRCIEGRGIWVKTIWNKYNALISMLDWIRTNMKYFQNASFIWKKLVLDFLLMRKWILWRVWVSNQMIIGEDP